jgi:L-seryl-tRNA(Ser) seleniumtransferase
MPLHLKSTRRTFMSSLGVMAGAVTGAMTNARSLFASAAPANSAAAKISGFGASGNVYDELGVPTVINGQGTMTMLGGSLARPEVEAVMALAGQHFCSIPDLEVAAGKRIAEMLKLPDGYTALVTSGAAAAMQSGLAGILTGDTPKFRNPTAIPSIINSAPPASNSWSSKPPTSYAKPSTRKRR